VWSVYIIRCADDTLYTGISTAVERRLREHAGGGPRAARYLRGRGPLRLVYACTAGDRAAALRIEHRLKRLPKETKEMLIAGRIALDALDEQAHDR
jgi:putative endonuclease